MVHYSLGWQLDSEGFVKYFLRAPRDVGMYCSCHAAQASKGNWQKTYYKTCWTSCRPTQYLSPPTWSVCRPCARNSPLQTASSRSCQSGLWTPRRSRCDASGRCGRSGRRGNLSRRIWVHLAMSIKPIQGQGGPTEFYSGNLTILYAVWPLSILTTTSLKRHIKYFNFCCKIGLDLPVRTIR